jgi:phage terminase small subunit
LTSSQAKPARSDIDELTTTRQKLFVFEYLRDRNATQAAIRAGYSPKTAGSQGHDLLKLPEIRVAVDRSLERLTEKTELSLERVVHQLHRILLADPADAFTEAGALKPIHEIPEDLRRAISGLDSEELWEKVDDQAEQIGTVKKLKFWSKTDASQQLLRVLGAFKDKVEHTADESLEALLRAAIPELRK